MSLCIGIGGIRVDQAVAEKILDAVSDHAVDAAILAADQVTKATTEVRQAAERELEEAQYEATFGVTPLRIGRSCQTPCCPHAGGAVECSVGTRCKA